jgi:short-subunit dehydrogenase
LQAKPLALVTGATSGIGKETVHSLTQKGYEVMALGRRRDRLNALASLSQDITTHILDQANPEEVEKFCLKIKALEKPISVLVNNAGYSVRGMVEEVPLEAVRRMYEVNYFSLIRLTQACLAGMRKARSGWIFNLSSISGKITFPANGFYSSSKHALEAISDALRAEVGPFGIKVVAIRPGPIATEFGRVVAHQSPWLADSEKDYQPVHEKAMGFLKRVTDPASIPGPRVVSDLIMKVLEESDPKPAYAVGPMTGDLLPSRLEKDDAAWCSYLSGEIGLDKLKI